VKDDRPYLEHIDEAIRRIISYSAGEWDEFSRNSMAQDAIIRNLEIVGEAVKHLSAATKARRPEIPWQQVAGLRDVLIHDYMGVSLRRVWNVVRKDLPELHKAIQSLLERPE